MAANLTAGAGILGAGFVAGLALAKKASKASAASVAPRRLARPVLPYVFSNSELEVGTDFFEFLIFPSLFLTFRNSLSEIFKITNIRFESPGILGV